jgi:hypothetical protein
MYRKPGIAADEYELTSCRRCLQIFLNRDTIFFGQAPDDGCNAATLT